MKEDDILTTTETVETEMEPPTTVTTTTTGTKPKEQRKEKQKQQISHIPAKYLRLVEYTSQTKPFPWSLTYEHLKERYKITYTADKSMKEILDIINNNQIRFLDTDLKIIEDSTFKKIRPGKEEKSPQ